MPSSAATSAASAVTGFVTDAQRNSASRGPSVATTSPSRRTPTATVAPQPSTCRRASTRRDTSRMGRRLISSGSPYEPVAGFSRAVVVGQPRARRRHRAGHARRRGVARRRVRAGAPLPRDHRRRPRRGRRRARGRRSHADVRHVAASMGRRRARTRRGVLRDPPRARPASSRNSSTRAGVSRSRRGDTRPVKQIYPASITGKSFAAGGSVLDHKFGQSEPYTLGVEEEYMLLDPETFDLVQHIDTVLEAMAGDEFEAHVNPELMQSVLEVATPVCRTPADVERTLRQLRAYVTGIAHEKGLRVGSAGDASVQPLRAPADHRARPLPQPRRPDAVRRAARADLRPARARRDRRSRTAIQVVNGMLAPPRAVARAVGELAVLARRADRPRVVPADGLRRLPALGPAAAVPRLRRVRRGRGPAREDRLHRRLHAHLVGHPAPSAARHGRGAHLRRGHAARGRDRDRRVRAVAREALLRAGGGGRGDPDVPPDPDDGEQVARRPLRPRGAGHGSRDRASATAFPSRSSSGGR